MTLAITRRIHQAGAGDGSCAGPVTGAAAQLSVEVPGPDEWDSYAARCEGVSQEQLWAFSAGRWPNAAFEPLVFRDQGEDIGGALMMVLNLPLGVGQVVMCKNGPVLRCETDAAAPERHARMLRAIVQEYGNDRRMMVSVSTRAQPAPENHAISDLLSLGFRPRAGFTFPNRYFVDLQMDDGAQLASFDQKWRYNLRKALASGLTFEQGCGDQLSEFDALYRAMSSRKRFPDYSAYTSLQDFIKQSPAAARPELFFVRHDGVVVAGAVIFAAGNTAVYLYGATNEAALPLRAGYLMHWEIIRWLKRNTSARWYDLGGTDGFQGLHQFKKGMVGGAGFIVPTPPVMTYASSARARAAGGLAYAAHNSVQRLRHGFANWQRGLARPDQDNGGPSRP